MWSVFRLSSERSHDATMCSRRCHVPGSAFYDRTVAELWFKTAEDAEAAGFQLPPSQRAEPADKEEE